VVILTSAVLRFRRDLAPTRSARRPATSDEVVSGA